MNMRLHREGKDRWASAFLGWIDPRGDVTLWVKYTVTEGWLVVLRGYVAARIPVSKAEARAVLREGACPAAVADVLVAKGLVREFQEYAEELQEYAEELKERHP